MRSVINELFMTLKITLGVRWAASEGNVIDLSWLVLSGLWAYQLNYDGQVVGDKVNFEISSNHAFAISSNAQQVMSCLFLLSGGESALIGDTDTRRWSVFGRYGRFFKYTTCNIRIAG